MTCEFCDESNHDLGVTGLRSLFAAITGMEETDERLHDQAHAAWAAFRRSDSISIPNDGPLLANWLGRISQ